MVHSANLKSETAMKKVLAEADAIKMSLLRYVILLVTCLFP